MRCDLQDVSLKPKAGSCSSGAAAVQLLPRLRVLCSWSGDATPEDCSSPLPPAFLRALAGAGCLQELHFNDKDVSDVAVLSRLIYLTSPEIHIPNRRSYSIVPLTLIRQLKFLSNYKYDHTDLKGC